MRYAGIIKNDFNAAPGVCTTFFVQGCPIKCKGCHNPDAWDFSGGKEFLPEIIDEIKTALVANGIKRKFCIMGGEPLCQENLFLTKMLVNEIKTSLPDIEIYLWTGYKIEDLESMHSQGIDYILNNINCIIDGPYIEEERDVTLFMRGSRNQTINYLT